MPTKWGSSSTAPRRAPTTSPASQATSPCSQDLQIGVINGGGTASQAQKGGLDNVAIYPGILTAQQVTDLTGDGTDLSFSHAPSGTPAAFFFEIRED